MWVCGYEDEAGWKVSIFDTEKNATQSLLLRAINHELNPGTEEHRVIAEAYDNVIFRSITAREALDTPAVNDVLTDAYFNFFVKEAEKEANQFGMIVTVPSAECQANPI